MNEEQFLVYNDTDGVFASPSSMSLEEAYWFVKDFPKKYQGQGYYLTADGFRINPEDVVLVILEA